MTPMIRRFDYKKITSTSSTPEIRKKIKSQFKNYGHSDFEGVTNYKRRNCFKEGGTF